MAERFAFSIGLELAFASIALPIRTGARAMPLTNLQTRAVETLVHPYTNQATFRDTGPLVLERGKGVYVYDTEGKPYLEGMAGLWCTALGYDNEELVEAAVTQMRKLPFAHLFTAKSHDPAIELAEKLKEIAPVPISKVFFCNSGSEANDSQMKMIWLSFASEPELQKNTFEIGTGAISFSFSASSMPGSWLLAVNRCAKGSLRICVTAASTSSSLS